MPNDYLQFIFQAINTLLQQNLGFFDAMGQNLFRMFATILVAWFGIKIGALRRRWQALSPLRSTSRVFCLPSALDLRWSITTALRSPASAELSQSHHG